MGVTELSISEFGQDVRRAQRAADEGPVIIMEHGQAAYVLLRHDAYRRLTNTGRSILDLISEPGTDDIDFDPPRMDNDISRPPTFP